MSTAAAEPKGFSLIEMLLALVVAVFVLTATTYFLRAQNGTYVGQRERLSIEDTLRTTTDFTARMLKGATALPAVSITGTNCSSSVTFSYMDAFGVSTGGNTNDTLNDTGAVVIVDETHTRSWTTNEWTGYKVVITSGSGNGQTRTIASNTGSTDTPANQLVVTSPWAAVPDETSVYKIVSDRQLSLSGTTLQYQNISTGSGPQPLADHITCFTVQPDPSYGTQYNIAITGETARTLPDTGRTGKTTLYASVDVRN